MASGACEEVDYTAERPYHRQGDDPTHLPPGNLSAHGLAEYSPQTAATIPVPSKHPPLDQLFGVPAPPPSLICPQRFPGIDSEATDVLIKTLEDNHVRWHIFFNYKGFHNHAAHHLLAIWAMGASGPVIDAAYVTHCEYQRPAFESPGHITQSNVFKHLGDERYYSAYLDFFTTEILKKGLSECLEEYVFSPHANFSRNFAEEQPEMLSRFVEGVFHPLIHTGYGAEFGLVGISAEGLAMTAVHGANPDLLSRSWFPDVISSPTGKGSKRSALSILALVACDPRFSNIKKTEDESMYAQVLKEQGSVLQEYAQMWVIDISSGIGIAEAAEGLSWLNTIIYGVGGYSAGKPFKGDFFLMHLLTSSLFLPSLLLSIPKYSSRRLLLLTYFTASLAYYLARGRPRLDVRSFYKGTGQLLHKVPGPSPSPAPKTLPKPTSDHALTPNGWFSVIQTTLVHPNEHLCKAQRALAHYSTLYGVRKKGWCAPPTKEGRMVSDAQLAREEEAEGKMGLEELDGTLFLRVAMLTLHRLGWMREGETEKEWDFDGFFDDDVR
ncbi:hypothetical protein F5I97DRAFT_1025320 [Phlebopus sp. FC_14]|nr:hypothetical protein F5I97DRAFT_1025320 [Phlebopus sp. FC_14]